MLRFIDIGAAVTEHEFELDGVKYLLDINRGGVRRADGAAIGRAKDATLLTGVVSSYKYDRCVTPDGMIRWKQRPIDVSPAIGTDLRGDWYIYRNGKLKLLCGGKVHYSINCPVHPGRWFRFGPYDVFNNGWVLYRGDVVKHIILPCRSQIESGCTIGDDRYVVITERRAYAIANGVVTGIDNDFLDECFSIGDKLYVRDEGVVRVVTIRLEKHRIDAQ